MNLVLVLLSFFAGASYARAAMPAAVMTSENMDPRNPVPWTDVMWKGYYYLTMDLPVNEHVQFPKGTKFSFVSANGAGGIPVSFFELAADQCALPQATQEMFLLNPTGRKDDDIGVELREDCHLVFFVEDTLVGHSSIFTDSTE